MTIREALHITLDSFKALPDNWNENGAKSFSPELIRQCHDIVDHLTFPPFIAPTACGSIQFEFEKGDSDYLELEVYEDKVKIYSAIQLPLSPDEPIKYKERYEILSHDYAPHEIDERVVEFYHG